ncbi:HpcH/HpaI aldolase family protein [Enterovirga rhinocerotis]|uniref:4-hydroxy-2-oxoheptanedioate aldolase n=1 Tax=Enterovirga rhinocerotis TaxID=1339210 RepID=A0A4R7BRC4_9HYPH|nr:aldolase/citrate lyase family protein [Enterovirga rhinocerotis]TDR88230.1 4-hydroxy-2-oxoheptanedioate aldolase [Enterovirga rhinocerotis]
MSSVQQFAADLKAGQSIFTHWCGIPHPSIAGLLAREPGFGAVVVDLQHNPADFAMALQAIPLVAAAGKPCVVRIPVGEFQTASRLLDAGASGIIAPMINSVEDARRFVEFTKFPPLGGRSWGPVGALALTGLAPTEYFRTANDFSVTFAMIETREALDAIDDILAVDGIDGIFIGPSDLSIGLSGGTVLDPLSPAVDAALDHAGARARAAGKFAGAYTGTGERAADNVRRGFGFVAIGSDTAFLKAGAAALRKGAG